MSIDQTNDHPHRSNLLNMIPIEDYNKLAKELEQASNRIKKLESRNSLHEGILGFCRNLPERIMIGVLVFGAFYCVYWGFFKGVTHGERARQIAEREAISYVSRRHGPASTAVCNSFGNHQQCFVRLTDPSKSPVIIHCDDDEPEYNDGCWMGDR